MISFSIPFEFSKTNTIAGVIRLEVQYDDNLRSAFVKTKEVSFIIDYWLLFIDDY